MKYCDLSQEEKRLRRRIAKRVREMIKEQLPVADEDSTSIVTAFSCRYPFQSCIR